MAEHLRTARRVEPTPGVSGDASQRRPNHPPSLRSRVVAALLAVGLVASGGYVAWVAFTPNANPQPSGLGPGEVHRIRLNGPPQPTAAGEGAAWTAVGTSETEDVLWRIDAVTEKPDPLPNTRGAGWPAVGEGFAWVTCLGKDNPCKGPSVLKLDPRSGKTLATIPLPEYPFHITTGLGAVWVTMSEGLAKLDPVEGRVTAVFEGRYNHVGTAGGSVWATSYDPDRVSKDVVWIGTCVGGVGMKETLTKIDAKAVEVVFRAPLASYGQMRVVGEALWAASHPDDRGDVIEVVQLNPESGDVAGESVRIPTGELRFMSHGLGSPGVFVAAADRSLWLTDFGAGEVIRLGLPSVSHQQPSSDPAVSPSAPAVATPVPGTGLESESGAETVPVEEVPMGANEGLPPSIPSSFPFPHRTTSCGGDTRVEEGRQFFEMCFRVEASYDEVVSFYQQALPEKGWTLEPLPHLAEGGPIGSFELTGHSFLGRLEIVEEASRTALYLHLESGTG
jgi:hypothetical protein